MSLVQFLGVALLVLGLLNVVHGQGSDTSLCSVLLGGTALRPSFNATTVTDPVMAGNNNSDVLQAAAQQFTLICLLNVTGSGSTAPDFRWSWNTNAVPTTSGATECGGAVPAFTNVVRFTGLTDFWNASLVLCAATRADAGVYSVSVADNTLARVSLYAPAILTAMPSNTEVTKGETVTVRCAANGYPAPNLVWLLNGAQLSPAGTRFTIVSRSLGGVPLESVETTLTLSNAEYSDRDNAVFGCEASNRRTSDGGSIALVSHTGFVFRVRDPLGALWPTLGILLQILVLTIVLFFDNKRKALAIQTGTVAFGGSESVDVDTALDTTRTKSGETGRSDNPEA